jgi:hypothetical protein
MTQKKKLSAKAAMDLALLKWLMAQRVWAKAMESETMHPTDLFDKEDAMRCAMDKSHAAQDAYIRSLAR